MMLVSGLLTEAGGPFHFGEIVWSILGVGAAGVAAAYVLTPPNLTKFAGPAWDRATEAAGITGDA
jgi:hypothetical protein